MDIAGDYMHIIWKSVIIDNVAKLEVHAMNLGNGKWLPTDELRFCFEWAPTELIFVNRENRLCFYGRVSDGHFTTARQVN